MISIIIPSFNRRKTIIKLLQDIYSQEHQNFEVIVVDDCSPDDTNEYIENQFPQVTLIKNLTNSGPAVSRNKGFKIAKGDVVIGFDSDVSISDPKLLAKTELKFLHNPDFTGLAFRILVPESLKDDIPRWWHSKPALSHSTIEFETSYFSGTAYAFRRHDFIEAGGFPEILYMHYEEVLLAFRIIDNGGRIIYCPELAAIHHASPTPRRTLIKLFYKPRNQLLLASLCMSKFRFLKFVIPRMGVNIYKAIINNHVSELIRAIRSYFSLRQQCKGQRNVLKAETWRRMKKMEQ